MEAMDTLTDFLAEARIAHQRNDWRASYAAFVRADGLGPMSTDDLDAYSAAAWRLGHGSEAVRLARACLRQVGAHRPRRRGDEGGRARAGVARPRTSRGVTAVGRSGAGTARRRYPRAERTVTWPTSTP